MQHNFDVDILTPSSKQKVKINKDNIEVNQQSIACADVTAIKYGVSLHGGAKNPTGKSYNIDILEKNGKSLNIHFNANNYAEIMPEDSTYFHIMSGLWQYVKKGLITQYINNLNENIATEIGNTSIHQQGVAMSFKTWFLGKRKTEIVPWNDLKYYLKEGILHIDSVSSSKKKLALSLHNDWNAVVLNTLMHYLWQDKRKEKLLKGEKI